MVTAGEPGASAQAEPIGVREVGTSDRLFEQTDGLAGTCIAHHPQRAAAWVRMSRASAPVFSLMVRRQRRPPG